MKKTLFLSFVSCLLTTTVQGQVYPGDTWAQLPTRNLYDTNMMAMYLQAWEETSSRRLELYNDYKNQAIEAYNEGEWKDAIYYVNKALNTQYYSGQLYFIRGYSYEQLGYFSNAKKDYKIAKKCNYQDAATALENLKAKRKRR